MIWRNLPRYLRRLPETSYWYRVIHVLHIPFARRWERINWLYYQKWLESASGLGLDWWGIRLETPRIPGESDADYRGRLLIVYTMRRDDLSLATKVRRLVQFFTELSAENIRAESVYNTPEARNGFRMGGKLGEVRSFSRDYIYFTFRFILPDLQSTDREKMISLIEEVTLAGNYPEFHEELGTIKYFGSGGRVGDPLSMRRMNLPRMYRSY